MIEPEPERVGRLAVRSQSADAQGSAYRDPGVGPELVLSREPIAAGSQRAKRSARITLALAVLLGVGLLIFAIVVRSGPAIGTVSIAIAALSSIFFFGGLSRASSRRLVLSIEGGELRVSEGLSVPLDRIEALGVGEDRELKTIWIRVRDTGRVMLLDGMTDTEAALAERHLRAVLDRRIES